jgi:hypothetical protein
MRAPTWGNDEDIEAEWDEVDMDVNDEDDEDNRSWEENNSVNNDDEGVYDVPL